MPHWRLLLLARITHVDGQMDAHQRHQNLAMGQGRRHLAGKTKLSKLDDDASLKHIFLLSLLLSPVRIASLRNTQEALLLRYCEGWLDEMEFPALYELNTSENLEFPYDLYDQFNLDTPLSAPLSPFWFAFNGNNFS